MIGRKEKPSAQDEDVKPKGFDDYDLRLGDLMRGERATIGKSLLDVQRELRIRASYIAAIENCDISAFETPGFIAGYVRSYARYLAMDPEWAYAKFCAEANFTVAHGMSAAASSSRSPATSAKSSEPLATPRINFVPRREPLLSRMEPGALGSVAVLLALIALIGYGGWSVLQEVQRVQLAPVDQAPGVIAELDPLPSGDRLARLDVDAPESADLPLAANSTGSPDQLARLYRPQALDLPVMVSRDGPIAAIDPHARSTSPDISRLAAAPQPAAEPVQVVAEGPPQVQILAVRPSWVRVRAADDTVLFEKILDAGERYDVPQTEEPATLRAGNSGSVYFVINGEAYGPSAPGAQIASNVILSAEALRERYTMADLGRDPDLASITAVAEAAQD